jgi:uncharacterized membrane protein
MWRWQACVGVVVFAGLSMIGTGPALAQDLDMKKIFRCNETEEVATAECDEARELILSNCTTCHAFVPIVLQQFDRNGWDGLLDRHRPRVSQLSEEQIETIGSYLAANFNADMPPPELPPALLEQWTDY